MIISGYSALFPGGILVGFVQDYNEAGGRFYEVTVKLSTDFKKLHNVYIVKHLLKSELQELKNKYMNQ